jgi:acyl-CoA synthetase (AMP-forming)/AMP-acid ligase II
MSPIDWVQHPAMLLRAIHEYRATLCWLPNFAYNHCARRIRKRDSEGLDLSSMRAFINCSEPVRHDSHLRFLERFAGNGVQLEMLAVSYAMAENTFGVTQTAPGQYPRIDVVSAEALQLNNHALPTDQSPSLTFVSCGGPIAGTQIRIVDDQGRSLPARRVGEILVKSDCLLTEYYRRPDLQPFNADGWYQTGDRGYFVDDDVFVIGRSKDLIINAGKNIYPQDIEAVVSEIEGIIPGRVAAFGVADEAEGTELIAVIAETPVEDADGRMSLVRAIRQIIVEQIAVTVTYVHLVEPRWLIKTSSGKVARRANRDKWLEQRSADQH